MNFVMIEGKNRSFGVKNGPKTAKKRHIFFQNEQIKFSRRPTKMSWVIKMSAVSRTLKSMIYIVVRRSKENLTRVFDSPPFPGSLETASIIMSGKMTFRIFEQKNDISNF